MRVLIMLQFIVYPSLSLAYIDPGVFAALSQALFVVFAGGVVAFVTAPWRAIKGLFFRCIRKSEPDNIDEEVKLGDERRIDTDEEVKLDDKRRTDI